ncbi:nuclear factor NF-kappa-B p105 subunit-like [Xenia sp. Carnegie-2017]|uniref:nuclear factor NF-kappa-B p105 subunit-like n=1 Tax=Xenia sp. Carnegie-2017 TaxID=2897299 RepID=UPI001F04B6E9|nr:nuclear factor NF-kappa-B p105 subunit-like [Xenia sp. Carnegie-2017]
MMTTQENKNGVVMGSPKQPRAVEKMKEDYRQYSNDSDSRVDSGLGSMSENESQHSLSSCTDSYYDETRNQQCVSSPNDSMDMKKVINKTEDLKIDEGYDSMTSKINYFQMNVHCVQSFAQTQNLRFMMAASWPYFLVRNGDGDTSLHLAIINCNAEVIDAIVDVLPKREYFDLYNNLIQTPLHLAVITRQHGVVSKLINHGASVELVDRNGQTCIHLACYHGDLKFLKAIFKSCPKYLDHKLQLQELLESRNFDGLTPLGVAVKENHINIVRELIKLGANTNAMDSKSGNTVLHLAAENNNLPLLSCLLFEGQADPNAQSFSGCTPLHIAAGLKFETIVATLVAVGAYNNRKR